MRTMLVAALIVCSGAAHAADDVLVADFESPDYRDWIAEGTAFGPGPAQGTLANQNPVSGYEGKRLVNSFYGGDVPTGVLTSPPITLSRPYLNFLIGGGFHADETASTSCAASPKAAHPTMVPTPGASGSGVGAGSTARANGT